MYNFVCPSMSRIDLNFHVTCHVIVHLHPDWPAAFGYTWCTCSASILALDPCLTDFVLLNFSVGICLISFIISLFKIIHKWQQLILKNPLYKFGAENFSQRSKRSKSSNIYRKRLTYISRRVSRTDTMTKLTRHF